jgi:hypothetical protein
MKRESGYSGSGRGKANRAQAYRPWNAAALGKPISEPTYDPGFRSFTSLDEPMDIDEYQIFEIDDNTQFRPWNATCLNKIDIIKNEVVIFFIYQISILLVFINILIFYFSGNYSRT